MTRQRSTTRQTSVIRPRPSGRDSRERMHLPLGYDICNIFRNSDNCYVTKHLPYMKLKYLDDRNCKALLPNQRGVPILRHLDDYLHLVNTKDDRNKGIIEKLIKHNERTIGAGWGSKRYYKYDIDIRLVINMPNQGIGCQTADQMKVEPIKLHLKFIYENGAPWQIILPLQFLLKGWGDANDGYQGYVHTIMENISSVTLSNINIQSDEHSYVADQSKVNEYYYVGITGRNWLKRMDEHVYEMQRGSGRMFYQKWRESLGINDFHYVSTLQDVNMTKEIAMQWEECAVDRYSWGLPGGLNMIPGGEKGLKYLHKLGITDRVNISLKEREKAIAEYIKQHPKKGIPNPFIKELWKDENHYLRVNEANPKRLSRGQVIRIRKLHALGKTIPEITKEVNALNQRQVKGVIEGKNYYRIH
jgi:hypothetical protein